MIATHGNCVAYLSPDGEKFTVASDMGEFQVYFNYGHRQAKVVVREYDRPVVMVRFVNRDGEDFGRIGRAIWPLYEALTTDEWPDHP